MGDSSTDSQPIKRRPTMPLRDAPNKIQNVLNEIEKIFENEESAFKEIQGQDDHRSSSDLRTIYGSYKSYSPKSCMKSYQLNNLRQIKSKDERVKK